MYRYRVEGTMPETESDPLGVAVRQVLAIAGALGLLGLLKDMMTWQHDIGMWIDAFRAFTRPIATFLFGWIPELFHLSFPAWAKDYLTVGVISAAAALRTLIYKEGISLSLMIFAPVVFFLIYILAWPIFLLANVLLYPTYGEQDRKFIRIFLSVYIYAAFVIALNYAFIAGGANAS
jgi:hypothetical protein